MVAAREGISIILPEKQPIRIDDIYKFRIPLEPSLRSDGKRVVYTVERMDKKAKTYYTNLYTTGTNGRSLKQLTFGQRNDHSPIWSPDGNTIAFISKRETASQIWLLPMDGGEARPLTKLPRGSVSDIKWSPDGKKILFLFHPLGKEVKVDKKGKAETPVYRHIKEIWYRLDGQGFFDSENTHVWSTNTKSGAAKQLVSGDYDDMLPCWSPDGKEIAFISFRHEGWRFRTEEQEIYRVSVNDNKVITVNTPDGPKEGGLSYSPDGKTLAYIGHDQPYKGWGVVNAVLNTVSIIGKNHQVHGKNLDRTAGTITLGDITPSFLSTSPIWNPEGNKIFYGISSGGRQHIVEAGLETGQVKIITENNTVACTWSADAARLALAYNGASLESPDELFTLNLSNGVTKQITHLNRKYINSKIYSVAKEIEFNNGRQKLMGWIVKPPNFNPKKKYPFILNIHGGPRCQYGRTFYHEMYVLAQAGYVVMYTNPRGSQGYGEKFAKAIEGKWAEPAMGDLMAAVDYAVSLGYIDSKRLGVTGGSYGGYMTNWVVTHTDRFKAAVTQRCVSDLSSMFGNSDVGWDMSWEFGGAPWENRESYLKWSPMTYIDKCITPLLIIHSEFDLRCNIEQGDQMFMALKYLKRDVEYVRFPEEPHGLSRHGRPDRREARLKFIVDWFDKYLK